MDTSLRTSARREYLGVAIQDDLRWGSHISSTASKANKTLGFLQHNLKIGNKKTKETVYKALVRPLLEYAATVWDPYTASETQAIEKVQRRAARWVSNRHRQTSGVNTMLDALDTFCLLCTPQPHSLADGQWMCAKVDQTSACSLTEPTALRIGGEPWWTCSWGAG